MEKSLFSELKEGLEEAVAFSKGEDVKLRCSVALDDGTIHQFDEPLTQAELEAKAKELKDK